MQIEAQELATLMKGQSSTSTTATALDGFPLGDLGHRIVVLDRGWVFVGRVTALPGLLRITDARCIRRWGTTQGLGELRSGPLEGTVLDQSGTVDVPLRAVIFTLTCSGF